VLNDLDPQTPVLVAWAAVEQHEDDPLEALDAAGLMIRAARTAVPDKAVLEQVDWIGVTEGLTRYPDPGRLVADAIGADGAHTVLARLGVMQQTVISEALTAVTSGTARLALVTGAEAKHRARRAKVTGVEAPVTPQDPDVVPDEVHEPAEELILECEVRAGLAMAVGFYAVMESTHRARSGESLEDNRRRLGELYARFTQVAAENPHADRRQVLTASEISDAPMLSFPYTTRMVSSWTVDQSAALFLCTAATAAELGIDRSRWVVPLAAVESNHMPSLTSRSDLTRAAAMRLMGEAAASATGLTMSDVDHLDLYSCFPIAVTMAAEGLGVSPDRDLTLTGGMPFAGGPFNNYVFQATCRAADLLVASPEPAHALVTCVSGLYTKQGLTLWSSAAPAQPFTLLDVTEQVRAAEPEITVVSVETGSGTIAGCTVLYDKGEPSRAVAVLDLDDGNRTTVGSSDPTVIQAMLTEECVGRAATVAEGQLVLS
jgi:acetyl-CoA C-acetyltransferase